jgi:hypothetical protein
MHAIFANVIEIKGTKCEADLLPAEENKALADDLAVAYLSSKKIRRIRECSDLRAWWDKDEEVNEPVECAGLSA